MRGGVMNTTKTKRTTHSAHGVFAMSIVLAIVLSITYQSVTNVGTSVVQADNMVSQTQSQSNSIRANVLDSVHQGIVELQQSTKQSATSVTTTASPSTSTSQETISFQTQTRPVAEVCEPSTVKDIENHIQKDALQRALDHCLVYGYEDEK